MPRPSFSIRALGLCAAVVGLLTLGAGSAQAEESGGSWSYFNGGKFETLPNNEVLLSVSETGSQVVIATEILKKKVEFTCTWLAMSEGKLITGGTVLFSLTLTGCTTKVGGVTSAACEPRAKGIHTGWIITNRLKGTLLLHKLFNGTKDKVIAVEPDTGEKFLAVVEMSELCSIGEEVPIGGKISLIDGEGSVYMAEHLITGFPALTHMWTISDTFEHAASMSGSQLWRLGGANAGKLWAMLWN